MMMIDDDNDDKKPRPFDVLSGSTALSKDHPGNKLYNHLIQERRWEYQHADKGLDVMDVGTGKRTKGMIIDEVISIITQEHGGRFLKRKVIRHHHNHHHKSSKATTTTTTTTTEWTKLGCVRRKIENALSEPIIISNDHHDHDQTTTTTTTTPILAPNLPKDDDEDDDDETTTMFLAPHNTTTVVHGATIAVDNDKNNNDDDDDDDDNDDDEPMNPEDFYVAAIMADMSTTTSSKGGGSTSISNNNNNNISSSSSSSRRSATPMDCSSSLSLSLSLSLPASSVSSKSGLPTLAATWATPAMDEVGSVSSSSTAAAGGGGAGSGDGNSPYHHDGYLTDMYEEYQVTLQQQQQPPPPPPAAPFVVHHHHHPPQHPPLPSVIEESSRLSWLDSFIVELEQGGMDNPDVVYEILPQIYQQVSGGHDERKALEAAGDLDSTINNGMVVLMKAIQRHPRHLHIQQMACRLIRSLVCITTTTTTTTTTPTTNNNNNNNNNRMEEVRKAQTAIGQAGGVAVVVQAMKTFPDEEYIQLEACQALVGLVSHHHHEANQTLVGELGGIEAIIQNVLMMTMTFPHHQHHPHHNNYYYKGNIPLQSNATWALAWIVANHHTANQTRAEKAGGIECLVNRLQYYFSSSSSSSYSFSAQDETFLTHTCHALANISSNHEWNQSRVGHAGGMESLIRIMQQRHHHHHHSNLCHVIATLTANCHVANQNRIGKDGLECILLALMMMGTRNKNTHSSARGRNHHHRQYYYLCASACEALGNVMANHAENQDKMMGLGLLSNDAYAVILSFLKQVKTKMVKKKNGTTTTKSILGACWALESCAAGSKHNQTRINEALPNTNVREMLREIQQEELLLSQDEKDELIKRCRTLNAHYYFDVQEEGDGNDNADQQQQQVGQKRQTNNTKKARRKIAGMFGSVLRKDKKRCVS